jgi:hypothetical protein
MFLFTEGPAGCVGRDLRGGTIRCVAGAASLHLDVGQVNDWRPLGDLAFYQSGERLWAAAGLVWNVAAQFEQTLSGGCVIKRPVERNGEFVNDRLWCCLRSE